MNFRGMGRASAGSHQEAASALEEVAGGISQVVLGKEHPIRLALACLIARGHLLIEDIPGVGKTLLGHALARLLGLAFQRVQFTSDLLPGDVLGTNVFERETSTFRFHPGPVFTQVLLADEVNRATPKSQSALLEAMEERQVTVEGETRALPEPFFVIATQNPFDQVGTFPLPESQLDRFLMRIELGYPDPRAERMLLEGRDRRELLREVGAKLPAERLLEVQREVPEVRLAPALVDYLQAIVAHTRRSPDLAAGLSPRAGVALTRAAQAWALLERRAHVLPEDVQAVFASVVGHRLRAAGRDGPASPATVERVLREVAIP